ncbi:MAG: polysaccharide deacetylase family protein [Rikenellaceae bacterium]|nr:polysaccharide deacetylase family protein [Rikenellaceae bacterium]
MNYLIVAIVMLLIIAPFIAAFKIEWGIYLRSTCRLDTKAKVVAITFDDGPDDENLPELLDLLDKKSVKSTFFFIGKSIRENPDLLVRTNLAGHKIGIHTYTHAPMLPFYSVKRLAYEIFLTKHLIKSIININVSLFRPPFGVTNPNIAYVINRTHLNSIGWSIRSFDTVSKSDDKVVSRISRRLKPGSIILLHSNIKGAARLAEKVIDEVRLKGYKIVNI